MDAPAHSAPLAPDGLISPRLRQLSFLLLVLLAAGSIVAMERLRPGGHEGVVLAVALGLPALLVILARPIAGLALYLAVLPLVATGEVAGGLNGGELLTLGVVVVGLGTAWNSRSRIRSALRDLGPILWPLAALAVVSVASLVANEASSWADILSAFLKIMVFGLVALVVYMNAAGEKAALALVLAVLGSGLLVAIYSIIRFALGLEYYETWGYHRAAGPFTEWNHLGGFMALTSVPTLAFGLSVRRPSTRWLFIAAFVTQIVALLLSLTMGSVLALLVGGLLGGIFLFRIPLRRIAAVAASFAFVFLGVLALNPFLQEKVTRLGERVVDRLITYSVGISMLQDKVWFGFGSQSRVVDAFYASADYQVTVFGMSAAIPHMSLLLIGVEKGIFGLIFYLFLIVGALRLLVRQRAAYQGSRYQLLYQGLVVGLLAFLVQDMTNNLLLHARLGILFLALLAGMVALGQVVGRRRVAP